MRVVGSVPVCRLWDMSGLGGRFFLLFGGFGFRSGG